jgi:hypothetical protein
MPSLARLELLTNSELGRTTVDRSGPHTWKESGGWNKVEDSRVEWTQSKVENSGVIALLRMVVVDAIPRRMERKQDLECCI